MQVPQCLGLMDLKQCHSGSGFPTGQVSPTGKTRRVLTGPGRERRLHPPGGVRAQFQSNGPLHREDARVTLSHSTIKGGEGGGPGSKRCLPRTGEIFMHLWEERNWSRWLRTSSCHPKKPIVQPRGLGTWWRIPHKPDPVGGPGKHSHHFWIRIGHSYRTRRRQLCRHSPFDDSPSDAAIDIRSSGGALKDTDGAHF